MKYLKILLTTILFIFVSNIIHSQVSDVLFENIAITNIKAIEKTNGKFYYELTLKDFSGQNLLPEGFGLSGHTFMDNGNFNDKKANDGIYTAKEETSIAKLREHPITQTVIYDESFKFENKLKISQRGVGCKIRSCGCPCDDGINCPACSIFGFNCWTIYDCEFIIDVSVEI